MIRITIISLALLFALPVQAQEEPVATGVEQRLALSHQMHDIKPARLQVEGAIAAVSQRIAPENREMFKQKMMESIDYERMEILSIESMAEVFTVAELEKMVAYFGSDEARSISEKLSVYQALIVPEMTKMIDKALMDVRTGGVVESREE